MPRHVSEISLQSESSFRTVFTQVSETTAAVYGDNEGEQRRLMLLLETLLARMLEILTGKPGSSLPTVADSVSADAQDGTGKTAGRRIVEQQRLVEETGGTTSETGGRPARLFRFRREILDERAAGGTKLPRTR